VAAVHFPCANCGEAWDRRAHNQHYCDKPDCRQAHTRDRKREWRHATKHREQVRRRSPVERLAEGKP
jgi:hypothetical protein